MASTIQPIHFGKLLPPPFAGIEAHIDLLLRSLSPTVSSTLVACGDPADAVRKKGDFPYRLIVERLYGRVASAPLAPSMITTVLRELRAGRSNLLHLHAPNPMGDLTGLLAAPRTPVVLSWHSDVVRQRKLLHLYGPIQRRIIDRADSVVVATAEHYTNSTQLQRPGVESKIRVVPYGFDFSRLDVVHSDPLTTMRLEKFAAGRPLLLTVGRHIYYKGYEFLLAAISQLRSDAVLVMIGTGPLSASLRLQAQVLGIADRVLFMAEVGPAELVAAYHRSDIFTLPSIAPSEAFGLASAEAMACGKPTVVCELHNGVNYLNQAGITSLSVPPRNVSALADALDILLSNESLRSRMGIAARDWVHSEFGLEVMRNRTMELYRQLL